MAHPDKQLCLLCVLVVMLFSLQDVMYLKQVFTDTAEAVVDLEKLTLGSSWHSGFSDIDFYRWFHAPDPYCHGYSTKLRVTIMLHLSRKTTRTELGTSQVG